MDKKENKALQKDTQQSYQETKQPNKITIDAIKEGRKIAKDPTAIGFWSIEKLKKEL